MLHSIYMPWVYIIFMMSVPFLTNRTHVIHPIPIFSNLDVVYCKIFFHVVFYFICILHMYVKMMSLGSNTTTTWKTIVIRSGSDATYSNQVLLLDQSYIYLLVEAQLYFLNIVSAEHYPLQTSSLWVQLRILLLKFSIKKLNTILQYGWFLD